MVTYEDIKIYVFQSKQFRDMKGPMLCRLLQVYKYEKNDETHESNKQKRGWRLLPFVSRDNEKIAEIGV